MSDFFLGITRFAIRAVLFVTALVFFLALMAAAAVLGLVWAVRSLWARISGKPVAPWVMPAHMRRSWNSWADLRQRANQQKAANEAQTQANQTHHPSASRRSGVLPQVAGQVTDVQPREL